MLVECKNCGAPLDVEGNATFVDCQYCKQTNKVASTKTLMMATPAGWQAPPQWTEADRLATQRAIAATATTAAATTGATGCISAIVGLVVTIVVGGVIGFTALTGSTDSFTDIPGAPGLLGPVWDGTAPFACGGNDSVTIEGVTANLPNDTAIRVSSNCELTIIGSSITARVGIEADGNRSVRLQNTVIQATETGIFIGGNKQLVLDQSDVVAGGIGVHASGNAQTQLRGGKIEGSPAMSTSGNARLENLGGNVVDL